MTPPFVRRLSNEPDAEGSAPSTGHRTSLVPATSPLKSTLSARTFSAGESLGRKLKQTPDPVPIMGEIQTPRRYQQIGRPSQSSGGLAARSTEGGDGADQAKPRHQSTGSPNNSLRSLPASHTGAPLTGRSRLEAEGTPAGCRPECHDPLMGELNTKRPAGDQGRPDQSRLRPRRPGGPAVVWAVVVWADVARKFSALKALRRHRRPTHLRRSNHRNRDHQLQAGPRPSRKEQVARPSNQSERGQIKPSPRGQLKLT